MPTTRLQDVFKDEGYMRQYRDLTSLDSVEKSLFFESGIATRSELLDEAANSRGYDIALPFWHDLDADDEPDIVSDDPDEKAVPSNVDADDQIARKQELHKSWSGMTLVTDLAKADPLEHVALRTATYWKRQFQRRLIAASIGLMKSNIANNNKDMVTDSDSQFNRRDFIKALYSMGDAVSGLTGAAIHSIIAERMAELDDVETIKDSEGKPILQLYQGKVLFIDDGMPLIGSDPTAPDKVVSVIFGNGAFGFGNGSHPIPEEFSRDAKAGNGAGEDVLHNRKIWIIHPFGTKFSATGLGKKAAPSLNELKDGARWSRVVDRKQIPISFLISKI